ncbi:MAG: FMN-binding negative transcriptional regulator [Sulfitobacter sp.]
MHPNPIFHDADSQKNLSFARDVGFGMLVMGGAEGAAPLISHVPFVLNDAGDMALLHLVRSNPIARGLAAGMPAKIAVSGPDGYVSPDWYGVPDQVPTWNYVAVHLTGVLEMLPQAALRGVLDQQSTFFEARLAPKAPWRADKMTPEALEKMMRQIVPCQFRVTGVDGTWKLSQNKPDAVRLRAADAVAQAGQGNQPQILAQMMQGAGAKP